MFKFYDYDKCLAYYAEEIKSLKQNKLHGAVNIAKPVLVLAVIQLIEEGLLQNNIILLAKGLEDRYSKLYEQYDRTGKTTRIDYPFYFMHNDGFWNIKWIGEPKVHENAPWRKFMREHVEYAYLDEDLWYLLQNTDYRHRLMEFVIKEKLSGYQQTTQTPDLPGI